MTMNLSGDQSLGAEEPSPQVVGFACYISFDANTLAKVVNGICDNPLTSMVRAWNTDGTIDGKKKSIVVALP